MKTTLSSIVSTNLALKPQNNGRPANFKVREVAVADLDVVAKIEEQSFDYPWTRREFTYCLQDSHCRSLLIEEEGRTIGYLFYEARNSAFRLLSCAVAPTERRRGAGSKLIETLIGRLEGEQNEIFCVVRETNVQAQMFLRRLGFRATWILHDFYGETKEDAYRMSFQTEEWELASEFITRRLLTR